MGQRAALGVLGERQQRARGGVGQRQLVGVEALQIGHAQLLAQFALA